VQSRAKHIVCGAVIGENLRNSPGFIWVEQAFIPIHGICVALVLAYTSSASRETQKEEALTLSSSTGFEIHTPSSFDSQTNPQMETNPELRCPCDTIVLMVVNFSKGQVTLPKGTVLGIAQEI
jgi:hypothetical protein